MMDINEIMKHLPHRYPFLLVDRVTDLKTGESISAIKNVTINEHFFQGHFPGQPIMPGVLIIEALAQTAGILAFQSDLKGSSVYFMSIDKAKFRRPVVPGDQIIMEVKALQKRGNVWKVEGTASVDGKTVAEAGLTAMVSESGITQNEK